LITLPCGVIRTASPYKLLYYSWIYPAPSLLRGSIRFYSTCSFTLLPVCYYSTVSSPSSVKPEDKPTRKLKRLTKAQKDAIVFTEEIKELIVGMILGDSTIIFPQGYRKGNARLKIQQKDKEFVDNLYSIFHPLGIVGAPAACRAVAWGPGSDPTRWVRPQPRKDDLYSRSNRQHTFLMVFRNLYPTFLYESAYPILMSMEKTSKFYRRI
jgi:hypothetical protein